MKYSKAALKTRHVQLGHLTMMQPTAYSDENAAPAERPRVYSTDRHTPSNNGIVIPHQLRVRIEVSMPTPKSETGSTPTIKPTTHVFMRNPWGFL